MNAPGERRDLLAALRARGLRLTPQRRALIALIGAQIHMDADGLLALAREHRLRVDRATVYRTIDLLKRLELFEQIDFVHPQGERRFYEVQGAPDHMHLACTHCGRLEDFSSARLEDLKREIAERLGFAVQLTRIAIGGACRKCGAEAAGRAAEGTK